MRINRTPKVTISWFSCGASMIGAIVDR